MEYGSGKGCFSTSRTSETEGIAEKASAARIAITQSVRLSTERLSGAGMYQTWDSLAKAQKEIISDLSLQRPQARSSAP